MVIGGSIVIGLGALLIAAGLRPVMLANKTYPVAPTMPPVVAIPIDDLIGRYEAFLRRDSPAVLAALRPGLSNAEIDRLEARYAFKLPNDLRSLYRWHDGTDMEAGVQAFPDHDFLPLQKAIDDRQSLHAQAKAEGVMMRLISTNLIGHRDPWLGLIVDHAGDGYYLDPNRSEAQGSFFFNFAEDGSYVFYPAFRNYLAAVIEGQEAGIFVGESDGINTIDFTKAQGVWSRYGAELTH